MTPQEKLQLEELIKWKKNLEFFNSIPLNIDQSFTERFTGRLTGITVSTKTSTSENQAVNEAGVATYSVLKAPDGFLEFTINATTYYIPIYT